MYPIRKHIAVTSGLGFSLSLDVEVSEGFDFESNSFMQLLHLSMLSQQIHNKKCRISM